MVTGQTCASSSPAGMEQIDRRLTRAPRPEDDHTITLVRALRVAREENAPITRPELRTANSPWHSGTSGRVLFPSRVPRDFDRIFQVAPSSSDIQDPQGHGSSTGSLIRMLDAALDLCDEELGNSTNHERGRSRAQNPRSADQGASPSRFSHYPHNQ